MVIANQMACRFEGIPSIQECLACKGIYCSNDAEDANTKLVVT